MRVLTALALASILPLHGACSATDTALDAGAAPVDAASGSSGQNAAPASGSGGTGSQSTSAGSTASAGSAAAAAGTGSVTTPDAGGAGTAAVDAGDEPGAQTCAIDAGAQDGCSSHLCTSAGQTFLVIEGDEPFAVGGLDVVASLCEHPIGWASARTVDNRQLVYALSLAQLATLQAGSSVLTYWGNTTDAPTSNAQACSVDVSAPYPDCPSTPLPPQHESLRGCRGPLDPGCAVCRLVGPSGTSFQSSNGGADWYNSNSTESPGPCSADCPVCATCSHRAEQDSQDLDERPDCEPCPGEPTIDACFSPDSCDCWCERREALREACPTLVR